MAAKTTPWAFLHAVISALTALGFLQSQLAAQAPQPGTTFLEALPTAFVENRGQWDSHVLYAAEIGPAKIFCEECGWIIVLLGGREDGPDRKVQSHVVVRMRFVRTESVARLRPEEEMPGRYNFLRGSDPARWRCDMRGFSSIRFAGFYPGVEVRVRGESHRLEYDLFLEPETDLSAVELLVEGAESLGLDGEGCLLIQTPLGPLVQPPPATWEEQPGGSRRPLPCRYETRGKCRYGFSVPSWRGERPLVVDPGLYWSSYLGGGKQDQIFATAVHSTGIVTVAGETYSADFPTTAGAFSTAFHTAIWPDVFVTRFNIQGNQPVLVYSTYLGGHGSDGANGLAVDAAGAATVAGHTSSGDYPVTSGAFQTTGKGKIDAFVTRLTANGSGLIFSTLLGGAENDIAYTIALNNLGEATVAGETWSPDFPTTAGVYDTLHNGYADGFVARLANDGRFLVWSTFLGGAGGDTPRGLALDSAGLTTIVGITTSTSFPTTAKAISTRHNGPVLGGGLGWGDDAFLTRIDAYGRTLQYSTYLGGSSHDQAFSVAVDAGGRAAVAGATMSQDFPVTKYVYDKSHNGAKDAFVLRLTKFDSLDFCTFLGGQGDDSAFAVALKGDGTTIVAGGTKSTGFPVTPGAWDMTHNGGEDAFLARLSEAGILAPFPGTILLYSTFLGGELDDCALGLALDGGDLAFVAGNTTSISFPTTANAYARRGMGAMDGFVSGVELPAERVWPPYCTNSSGGSEFGPPFSVPVHKTDPRSRIMIVMSQNSLPFLVPSLINEVSFRRDSTFPFAYAAISGGDLRMRIGNTKRPPECMCIRFGANWDGTPATVFSGALNLPPAGAPATPPAPFTVKVPFQSPYRHNGGNLALELLFHFPLPPTTWRLDMNAAQTGATAGTIQAIGPGCPGSNRLAPETSTLPNTAIPGRNLAFTLVNAPYPSGPSAVAFNWLGASSTSWAGIPLPFDLALLGFPAGCWLRTDVSAVQAVNVLPHGKNGKAYAFWELPRDFTFVGIDLYTQWFCCDNGVPSYYKFTISNALQVKLGLLDKYPPGGQTVYLEGATGLDDELGAIPLLGYQPILRFGGELQ